DLGRQGDRAAHLGARPLGRFDDLAGRTVDQSMIERLQPDPDLLVRHDGIPSLKERQARGWVRGTPGFNDCRRPKPCAPATFPAKNEAGRLPGPPRRRSERANSPGPLCPEELREGPGYCRATCSLSGEDEAHPAPHFAVP